jgi:tetratricopeptide (TPR) repeat protein
MKVLITMLLFFSPLLSQQDGNLEEAIRLYGSGEYTKAANLLTELKRTSPNEPKIRLWLGKTYIKARQWDDAVRELEKATQIEPSEAHYRLWLGRACGALAAHTFKLFAMGKAHKVIKEFEMASSLEPKDLDARFDMLEFYLEAPPMIGGGSAKAKAQVQEIAKLDPKKGPVARAMVLQNEKKYDLAKKELIKGTIDYPDYAAGYADLADFLLDQKDYEGALKYSAKALEIERSKHALLISAASRIRLRIDLDKAERSLNELASGPLGDYDPSFEEVFYWIGECHLANGNKEKARGAYITALKYNPEYEPAKKTISKLR